MVCRDVRGKEITDRFRTRLRAWSKEDPRLARESFAMKKIIPFDNALHGALWNGIFLFSDFFSVIFFFSDSSFSTFSPSNFQESFLLFARGILGVSFSVSISLRSMCWFMELRGPGM